MVENLNQARIDEAVNPNRFMPFEFANNLWSVTVLAGTPAEKLLDPTYWTHVATQAKKGDMIRAFWEDASMSAELIVLSVGKNALRVDFCNKTLHARAAEKQESLDPSNYKAEFIPEGDQWRVMRLSDNEVMVKGLDTQVEAEEWIEANTEKKQHVAPHKGKKAA